MLRNRLLDYGVSIAAVAIVAALALFMLTPRLQPVPPSDRTVSNDSIAAAPLHNFSVQVHVPTDHLQGGENFADLADRYPDVVSPALGRVDASPVSGCSVNLTATVQPLAMVQLDLRASCQPLARFVILHETLAFAVATDAAGSAEVQVPAFDRRARFVATLDNLNYASAEVDVPELRRLDRVALHWRSSEAINLHAFEESAFIGGPGHIWQAAPGSIEAVRTGTGGYLMKFADADAEQPAQVEVFTFPVGAGVDDTDYSLRISNLLNPANCGREIDFDVIEVSAGNEPVTTQLSPKMPGCGQIGYVVLLAKDLQTLLSDAR